MAVFNILQSSNNFEKFIMNLLRKHLKSIVKSPSSHCNKFWCAQARAAAWIRIWNLYARVKHCAFAHAYSFSTYFLRIRTNLSRVRARVFCIHQHIDICQSTGKRAQVCAYACACSHQISLERCVWNAKHLSASNCWFLCSERNESFWYSVLSSS